MKVGDQLSQWDELDIVIFKRGNFCVTENWKDGWLVVWRFVHGV